MAKNGFVERLKRFFASGRSLDEESLEELADHLVEGDLGAAEAFELVERVKKECAVRKISDSIGMRSVLREIMLDGFKSVPSHLPELTKSPELMLVLGVNGVGKTTSCAKLAAYYAREKKAVILAAADTFRAAAIDQLKIHGERIGVRVVAHKDGGDPAAVVFDALDAAISRQTDLVIADTAGRMHTKASLVEELKKIDRIAISKIPAESCRRYLVLDVTSGRNALQQAETFHEAVRLDGVILTKYDSSARGGVAWSLAHELSLPIVWICNGEGYNDINLFDAERYLDEFLGLR